MSLDTELMTETIDRLGKDDRIIFNRDRFVCVNPYARAADSFVFHLLSQE